MTRAEIMEVLQEERNKTKKIRQLKQTLNALNSRKFDYFSVSAVVYDQIRVQGGLSVNDAENANLRQITLCEKELMTLETVEKGFWELINNCCLDSVDKTVLLSYYYEGLSYRKIASILGYANHRSTQTIAKNAINKIVAKVATDV